MLLFGKWTTADVYSHLDFSSRVESADMIAGVLGDAESSFTRDAELVKHSKRGRKPKSNWMSTHQIQAKEVLRKIVELLRNSENALTCL